MSVKPFGYKVPRIGVTDTIVIALCIVGVIRQSLLHDWSDAFHSGMFTFIYWAWSVTRRESEAWQRWYDWTRGRVTRP